MSFDRWFDRRYDIGGATVFRKKDLDARARSLCCLDKDEFVFVGQDHGASLRRASNRSHD
jgi:hypothetical protein